jgi:hypothetical protein
MSDPQLIAKIGETVWGASWQAAMATAVRQSRYTIEAWANGREPVPLEMWKQLVGYDDDAGASWRRSAHAATAASTVWAFQFGSARIPRDCKQYNDYHDGEPPLGAVDTPSKLNKSFSIRASPKTVH